jgi:hypothetical protein
MKASDFLHDIFTRIGVAQDDEALANLVKVTATLDLPDEHIAKFHDGFLSLDAAKGKVKPSIIAEFSDGLYKNVLEKAKALGLTDEEIESAKTGEKNVRKVFENIMELSHKKAEENSKKSGSTLSEEYKKQLSDLQAKLETEKADAVKPFAEKLSNLQNRLFDEWQRSEFGSVPLAKQYSGLSETAKKAIIKDAIDTELSTLGGQLIYDFETGKPKLVQTKDNSVPLFHENKELDWNTLKSLSIQRHKLDVTSGGGGGDPDPQKIVTPIPGGDGKETVNRTHINAAYNVALNSLPK